MFNSYTTGFCPAGINIRNVFKILTVKMKSAMYFLSRKPGGGGGDSAHERGGDARRKF